MSIILNIVSPELLTGKLSFQVVSSQDIFVVLKTVRSVHINKRMVFLHKTLQTGTADVNLCQHQLIFFSITLSAGSLLI